MQFAILSLLDSFLDRVSDADQACWFPVKHHEHDSLTLGPQRLGLLGERTELDTELGNERTIPEGHGLTADLSAHALACDALESRRLTQPDAAAYAPQVDLHFEGARRHQCAARHSTEVPPDQTSLPYLSPQYPPVLLTDGLRCESHVRLVERPSP